MSGFVLKIIEKDEVQINDSKIDHVFEKKRMDIEHRFFNDQFYLTQYKPIAWEMSEKHILMSDGSFALYTGTMMYRECTYIRALQLFYSDYQKLGELPSEVVGDCCIVLYSSVSNTLIINPCGNYRVYHNDDYTIFSSSIIALRKLIDQASINIQESIEYIFCGTYFGEQTIIKEIKVLSNKSALFIKINSSMIQPERINKPVNVGLTPFLLNVAGTAELLVKNFHEILSSFGDNISMPITGGFDSRLLAAAASEARLHPDFCFVLHKDHQQDTTIAQLIADALGWNLTCIPNSFPGLFSGSFEQEAEQYYLYDGLGIGGIYQFHSGLDCFLNVPTRNLLLDGTGGEIYRNMYRLPNHRLSFKEYLSRTVLKFYVPQCVNRNYTTSFLENMTAKVQESLGVSSSMLSREETELLYSRFHISNWLTMNNSTAMQFIDVLYPYQNELLKYYSSKIPVREKTSGSYEARMISYLSPGLAKITSNYGYGFYPDIHRNKLIKEELLIKLSDPRVRRLLRIMKERTPKKGVPRYASQDFYDSLKRFSEHDDVKHRVNTISQFIDVTCLPKADQFSRALSVNLLINDLY